MLKFHRPLVVLGLVASLIAVFGLGGTAFAAATPGNGTTSPSSTTMTRSGHETLTWNAATCAKLKAAFPNRASDPKLCQHTHTWTETITLNNTTSSAIALSCPSGNSSFNDYDSDGEYYILQLNSSFRWTGNCSFPVAGGAYGGEQCFPKLLLFGTTATDPECYNYNYSGSYKSHADVYSVFLSFYVGPALVLQRWESQRRECKSDRVGDCFWAAWDGK